MVGTVTEYLSKMTTGMFHYVVIKIPSFSLSQLVLTVSSMCRSMYEEEIGVCVVLFFFKCNGKDATNIGIWTFEKQNNMSSIKNASILMMSVSGGFFLESKILSLPKRRYVY